MEHDDILFDKIEDYVRGRMDAGEKADFEQAIAADPELAEMVELHRLEQDGMELLVEDGLRQKMQHWDETPTTPDPAAPRKPGIPWRFLLPLLVALSAAGFWLFRRQPESTPPPPLEKAPEQKQTNEPVADQTITPKTPTEAENTEKNKAEKPNPRLIAMSTRVYELPNNLGSALKSTEPVSAPTTPFDAAIQAYKEKQYAQALRQFDQIKQQDNPTQYALAQEWKAHIFYQTGKYPEAAAIFRKMAARNTKNTAQDRAEWYLLLSLVPDYKRQKQEADALMQRMADPARNHYYVEDAIALRTELQRELKLNK